MSKTGWFWCAVVLGFCLVSGRPASAQQWATEMFTTTSHDFGALARGAKAEFAFTFKNPFVEDVRIKTVRSTCGCAGLKYPTEPIKTYQKGQIVVAVDTRGFLGRKDATLTVEFDRPFPAEVTLKFHCYIRKDVVFQPGSIQFGTVRQGEGARRSTTVSYAGRDDWQITAVESPSPFITTNLAETRRDLGRVTYNLAVDLKPDAPAGYLSGHLILKTNDANSQTAKVPLAIEGVVESELSVRPASLTFLTAAGELPLRRNVVVQGARPFRITAIHSPDPRLTWQLPPDARKFHVLPITFTPGDQPGKKNTRIEIETDLGEAHKTTIDVFAEVTGQR